jgi:hypothetical protein
VGLKVSQTTRHPVLMVGVSDRLSGVYD